LALAQTGETVFQGAMISSGRNRPSVSMSKENLVNLCGLLHRGVPLAGIQDRLRLSSEELQRKLDLLIQEGLVKRADGHRFLPAFVVVTIDDARKYFHVDDGVIRDAAALIKEKLPEVKSECRKIKSLADVPFEELSFFIGSNVLLDNWQINNVERLFVKADRPARTGGRYYYMIFEKPAADMAEPFGIYGNTGSQSGNLYGNDRFSGHTPLAQPFHIEGADSQALDRVAAVVTGGLIALLERNREQLLATYRTSPYAEETSFNEYFMCWYHFFYTAVTNRLRDEGVIKIPASGTISY
jgi:hypothetical protein